MSYNFKSVNYEDFAPLTLEKPNNVFAMQKKLLWTNLNPTNSFSAQTITTEDISGYDWFLITTGNCNNTNENRNYICENNKSTTFITGGMNNSRVGKRKITINSEDNSFEFSAGLGGSDNTDNNLCIPFKIFGIKLMESQVQVTNKYSTQETIVGEWLNGKPIYRKTIDVGNLPNSTTKFVSHGIPNLERVISVTGAAQNNSFLNLDSHHSDLIPSAYCGVYATGKDVVLVTTDNRSAFSGYVTIEYTKTTNEV